MPFEGESDRALVARVSSGQTEAFDTLHRRYYAKIYRLAYLQTNNRTDAEDIAAETFCRAFQRIGQFGFRQCESIYPWLHRIAVNLAVDLCRDRSAHSTFSLNQPLIDGVRSYLERLESMEPSPEELLMQEEVQKMVRAAIASLSEDQRDVITYRFIGEMPLLEIAEAMQRTEGAVKSLLHRAMESLRKILVDKLEESGRAHIVRRAEDTENVRGDSFGVHRRTE